MSDSIFVFIVVSFTMSIGFGLLVALESKSTKAGIRYAILVFLSIALIFALIKFFSIIDHPVFIAVVTVIAWIYSLISIRNYWHILRYGGRLASVNKSILKDGAISIIVVVGCNIFILFLFLKKPDTPIAIVPYFLALSGTSLSGFINRFQVRENGFSCRGKLVLFNDIQSMQWEHQLYKDKIKITLHSGKIITTKIPWGLILPVDDYVRKYQSTA